MVLQATEVAAGQAPIVLVAAGQAEQEETGRLRLWEADWDDEDVGDDFAQRLKAELGTAATHGSKGKAEPMQVSR